MRSLPTVAAMFLLMACTGENRVSDEPDTTSSTRSAVASPLTLEDADEGLNGLKILLSEANKPAPDGAGAPLADAKPLTAAQVRTLLARAPKMDRAERLEFALRKGSPPPPRPGEEVQEMWPPPERPDIAPDVATKDLTVLRFAPEGAVPMAPHVSVTFNQPMIAVTSQDEASKTVPVKLEPEPPGNWRWLGTKTLLFDPSPRLPMATEYTATIPKGTTSALGQTLTEDTTFTFSTPPVQVQRFYPSGTGERTDGLVMLSFDQAVDAKAIAPFVHLRGDVEVAMQPATDAEIQADPQAKTWVANAQEGRVLVFKPRTRLKTSQMYKISVDAGAPSAEGPVLTKSAQTQGFRTYDPLQITDNGCWKQGNKCNPDGQVWIRTNNALDEDTATDRIVVTPEVPGLVVNVSGSYVSIRGAFPPRSALKVQFKADLTDTFGQKLGRDESKHFTFGPAQPFLVGPGKDQVVLDPMGPAALPVYSRNHAKIAVKIYKVNDGNLDKVAAWVRDNRWREQPAAPPMKSVFNGSVAVPDYKPDELVETPINLAPYLVNDSGQFLVWASVPNPPGQKGRQNLMIWVQRTQVGLTAFADNDTLQVWVTDLQTGAPVRDAKVRLAGSSQPAVTSGSDGLATVPMYSTGTPFSAIVADVDGDTAILASNAGWWMNGAWVGRPAAPQVRWVVFDDRGMYKPNESATFKGLVRPFIPQPGKGLGRWLAGETTLTWKARDAQGAQIADGTTKISETGEFSLSIDDLGESPNLGTAYLELETSWQGGRQRINHAFQIQEFRRPEFEVSTAVDPRPYVLGEHAIATVEAAYYAGGGLPAAEVQWNVSSSTGSWRPDGWRGWTFGTWTPWWRSWNAPTSNQTYTNLQSKTGADGTHSVRMDFVSMNPKRPMSVRAEATVFDVNRQRWSSASTLLVHPADRYVGLKLDRAFVEKGKEVELSVAAVDLLGKAVAEAKVDVRFARLVWKKVKGTWKEVEENVKTCTATTTDSEESTATCSFKPVMGGSWRFTASITDAEGRTNETTRQMWVSGGSSQRPQRNVTQQSIELIPSLEELTVGDTLEVLVAAPFFPAEGVVTYRQDGLLKTERITLDGPTTTLKVQIEDTFVPTVHLEVDLVGEAERTDDDGNAIKNAPKRVAFASGSLTLKVPPKTRTLDVQLSPEKNQLQPGESTYVDVQVKGPDGQPVSGAEVALWMVDESVLALSGYKTPDPLSVFYSARSAGVAEVHLRDRVVLVDPESVRGQLGSNDKSGSGAGPGGLGRESNSTRARRGAKRKAPMAEMAPAPAPSVASARLEEGSMDDGAFAMDADMEEPDEAASPDAPNIEVRTDFRALAIFSPRLLTDKSGKVRLPVDLPDSLTRYRVMAVATDTGTFFGSGEATITARKPLMLRPSPPRFLNVGDKAEFPLVVQNPTDQDLTVDLALQVDNAKMLDSIDQDVLTAPDRVSGGVRFVVPAEDRREIRLPVGVIDAGTLKFQAVIASGSDADAVTDEFPVWTPATTEAFATYGTIDSGGIVQPVAAPDDAWPQYGGLEITTSSTQLQALTDAVIYLNQYPFACTEQVSSRMLANAALRDVMDAFEADGMPSSEDLATSMQADLDLLKKRQRGNGGFAFWGRERVYPYPSLHAVHALVRAKDKGWEPDPTVLSRGLNYAKNIERHIPGWYSERAKTTIRSYAVYVRHQAGDNDRGEAKKLYAKGLKNLPLEAQGWLLATLDAVGEAGAVQAIERNWDNKAVETAAAASFSESYTDNNDYVLLHSSRRTDGVLLEALLEVNPKKDLVVKVVRGLLGHRRKGRWGSTQENAFILLALDRYFREYEGVTPNFVAKAWLDNGFVGAHTFKGRTTERSHIDVPMQWLQDGPDERKLTVAMEGEGRLYYRIGMRYAPKDLTLPPADHGFAVERTYEAVDDEGDVTRDADGTYRIKAGAQVRVRLSMVAESRRTMVALVDPMPGGFEPMNPALAVTGQVPNDPSAAKSQPYWWWSRPWYNHQNLRDERAEAFTDLLWAGVHEYTYVAIATTPGRYVVPPPKAEEMYHPETFGRGAGERVVIE